MIFIDTGAFLARYIKRDQYHHRARKAWKRLSTLKGQCFTSNFVLDETFTFLARKTTYAFAAERARAVYASREISLLRPNEEDEMRALDDFQKYADQKVSFTDCVSFALLKKFRIKHVFSYDKHFERAGFVLWG